MLSKVLFVQLFVQLFVKSSYVNPYIIATGVTKTKRSTVLEI